MNGSSFLFELPWWPWWVFLPCTALWWWDLRLKLIISADSEDRDFMGNYRCFFHPKKLSPLIWIAIIDKLQITTLTSDTITECGLLIFNLYHQWYNESLSEKTPNVINLVSCTASVVNAYDMVDWDIKLTLYRENVCSHIYGYLEV